MTKSKMRGIDEKVKEEIVDTQIRYLNEKQPSELINYVNLRGYLIESLRGYFPEDPLNKEPDYDLLDKLEKLEDGTGTGRRIRLMNSVKLWQENDAKGIKNKDLLGFYHQVEQKGVHSIRKIRYNQYGAKTHNLLKDYLIKKGIISF